MIEISIPVHDQITWAPMGILGCARVLRALSTCKAFARVPTPRRCLALVAPTLQISPIKNLFVWSVCY